MYGSLREYIDLLEREGELVRIKACVNPVEEMAEIADRVVKHGGRALLFENTGTAFPVAMNLFGSDRRMALALGVASLDELPARIERLVGEVMSPKGSFVQKIGALPLLGEAARWFPKRMRGRGACQQVVRTGGDASLDLLPVLKCWPADGGRFVTLPMVNTADPATGAVNVGMYRMQVFDGRTTGMHWHMHKTGAKHYEAYRRAGRRMPVSVCLGGDPAYTYAATAPVPDGIDEYLLAGFLRGRPVRLVRCVTNDLYVPADCDFVIEGYVDPAEEKAVEGPFGDHTGFYSLEDRYPLFHVTAVTHRRDAVWPATVVGIPVQEDYYMAQATEKIFLAPIRLALQPDMEEMYMPAPGVAHNLAVVGLHVRYPGHVRQAVSSLWGAGQMMFNKYMLVAPAGSDVRTPQELARLLRGVEPERAAIRGEGALDVLDHAAAETGYGGKLALDLTGVPEGEVPLLAVPERIVPAGGIAAWSMAFYAEWGIVALYAEPGAEADIAAFVRENCPEARIAVLFDTAAQGLDGGDLLWLATADTDAGRDIRFSGGTLLADARTKLPGSGTDYPPRFPNVVAASEATIALVDARWKEYDIGEFLPSPSDRYCRLLRGGGAEMS